MAEDKFEAIKRRAEERKNGRTEDRKKRIPLGVPRMKGTVNINLPGKVKHWFNDNWRKDPARIQDALQGGYEFVTRDGVVVGEDAVDRNTDMGSLVSHVCGSNPDGTPIRRYLMAIDEEYYKEDQKAKQEIVDRTDAAIKAGTNKNTLGKKGYVAGIEYDPGGTP